MKKICILLALAGLTILSAAAGGLKTNYRTALLFAYSPANNVFEDENLRLEIYGERLWATNKTGKAIFVDVSQCFKNHNGSSYPMFDDKHQDEKTASKKAVSSSDEIFISIPPSTGSKSNATYICDFAEMTYGKYTTTETPSGDFSEYEERMFSLLNDLVNESLSADPKRKKYLGTASRHLTEDESIDNIGASIAYAFNKRSEEWNTITISTWVSDVYLAPYYVEMPLAQNNNEKRGFGAKKTEPAKLYIKADSPFEFEQDKSPITVFDWTGNIKKGTFILRPTIISKSKSWKSFFTQDSNMEKKIPDTILAELYDPQKTYKQELFFCGEKADWGKMSYLGNFDLTSFSNNDSGYY